MGSENAFLHHARVQIPLICGAMYPCSNPELVAAASAAGALGIVQPLSFVYAHGHRLRDALRLIRQRTRKPVGFNVIIDQSSTYRKRMRAWVEIALEEGVRFFVSALGRPDWLVRHVSSAGGVVYHDVSERKYALKALEAGVTGLICVNNRAGGHLGPHSAEDLLESLGDLDVPKVCAGGVGDGQAFRSALEMGYAAVQAGTRFIATHECTAHRDYKQAILRARAADITVTDKLSGIPCSVIRTPTIEKIERPRGPIARRLMHYERTNRLARTLSKLPYLWRLKRANARGVSYQEYFQAGKSVEQVHAIQSVAEVVQSFAAAAGQPRAVAD